jgi:hypothetical protein
MNTVKLILAVGVFSFIADHLTAKGAYRKCMTPIAQLTHLGHHIFMVFVVLAPFSRDRRVVLAGLLSVVFMLACWHLNSKGNCFVTEWINKRCDLPETNRLRNIIVSLTGWNPEKATVQAWKTSMYILIVVYIFRLR